MIFDSDILNWPLELADGLQNRWLRAAATLLGVVIWIIPIMLVFVTPLLIWNAFSGE